MSIPTFPELTDDLRPGLRQMAAWTTCFDAWREGARPSEAREFLRGEKETFFRHLDSLTWQVLIRVEPTERTPDDYAEALRAALPMWEQETTAEEIDAEDAHPLTLAERRELIRLSAEAAGEDTSDW